MVCTYCGAKYHKNEERCPYCNSENPRLTEKRKKRMMDALDREAAEMERTLPKKKVKSMHRVIVIVIAGLLGMLLIGTIVGVIWSKWSAKIEYAVYEKHSEKLEEMFQNEDWEAFCEYMSDHELWDSKYEKYDQVYDVANYHRRFLYDYYDTYLERLREAKTNKDPEIVANYKDMSLNYLGYVFDQAAYILVQTQKNANDRVILGNEKILKAWNEEVRLFLLEEIEMSEEDLELLIRCENEQELSELVNKYFERDFKKESEKDILKRN